jgi:hypothetical protein
VRPRHSAVVHHGTVLLLSSLAWREFETLNDDAPVRGVPASILSFLAVEYGKLARTDSHHKCRSLTRQRFAHPQGDNIIPIRQCMYHLIPLPRICGVENGLSLRRPVQTVACVGLGGLVVSRWPLRYQGTSINKIRSDVRHYSKHEHEHITAVFLRLPSPFCASSFRLYTCSCWISIACFAATFCHCHFRIESSARRFGLLFRIENGPSILRFRRTTFPWTTHFRRPLIPRGDDFDDHGRVQLPVAGEQRTAGPMEAGSTDRTRAHGLRLDLLQLSVLVHT